MQIGEFAKVCKTKVSVLRHYDKEGLLPPDYIDRFTGYRYYSEGQISVFLRITALKNAGFSLTEIKRILSDCKSDFEISELFEKKKNELQETLKNLIHAQKIMLGVKKMMNVQFIETENGIIAVSSEANEKSKARDAIENAIAAEGYQRVSAYRPYGETISCDVVKLQNSEIKPHENIDLPFENDESIVGKWETVGEFAVKEDFYDGIPEKEWYRLNYGIYFLPGGERYWCYGWTKGMLLIDNGDSTTVNDFTTEIYNGERYMFINLKSYNYRRGGKTTVLVLRQADNKIYTAESIARKDDLNKPFVKDERILGKWKAFDFCRTKEEFDPKNHKNIEWFFPEIEFRPDGEVVSLYDFGKTVISGRDKQEWTKGFLLRKWNNTACAYELKTVDGEEYLILEWKSGDYRYGGFDTDYYVFVRA